MPASIENSLQTMRRYYQTGATRSYSFRREQLIALKKAVIAHEEEIYAALHADLKKSKEEAWVTENGFLLAELNDALKNLGEWMEPKTVPTNLLNLPSTSKIIPDPLGIVLIIAPWNYPLQLLLTPLIGAMAAGNCAVLKPSEFAPATSLIMQKIIESIFSPEYILFVTGDGAAIIPAMMGMFTFDHIFYTGSTTVGRLVYKMAADKLVPVTLELGGKSPCVIEADARIDIAAKRIVMTKFSNAGQMCVAPDYLLVHTSVKEKLITELKKRIQQYFGDTPEDNASYGKIINEKQFDRVVSYLSYGNIVHGGRYNKPLLCIEPTVLDGVDMHSPLMQDEIFGPLLPIISFEKMDEALAVIKQHQNPLAFYIFTSNSKTEKQWLEAVPSGGACVNNASWHLTNPSLPFGGRGFSGTGVYHGKYSFDTFSHKRAVMKTPAWFDPSLKYPPYTGKLKLFKWMIR